MRGQRERDFVVIDGDIRVMIEFLGELTNLIDEHEGFFEIAEREFFLDRFTLGQLPAWERANLSLNLSL